MQFASRASLVAFAIAGCSKSAPPPVEPAPPATPSGNVEIADDALPLVDAWAEAVGGRDAIAKLGTVHVKGDCKVDGRECTFESWMSPKGEVRYSMTFPDGGFVFAYDGTAAWRHDGAAVADLTGDALERVLVPAFFESYSMFFPDRQHGSIKLDGATSIAVTPRGVGAPVIVRFRSDGAPVSEEGRGFKIVFTAWNEYLGVQIPQAWTAGPTGAENSYRLSRVDDEAGTYSKPAP